MMPSRLKKEKVKRLNAKSANIFTFSLFTFRSYRLPNPGLGAPAPAPAPIGLCWRKRRLLRLRAFTDLSFAFCPGGMK